MQVVFKTTKVREFFLLPRLIIYKSLILAQDERWLCG